MTLDKNLLKNILKLTFETNIQYFKESFPHFYEKFKNYEPKEYGLELDENNNLNIACNGHFIYAKDPKTTVSEQTLDFLKNPVRSIYRISPVNEENMAKENPMGFRHLDYLSQVARLGCEYEAKALAEDLHTNSLGRFPFLSVIGVGLGYHLEQLATENIDHLYIYEPNDDLFYSSLFTLNWKWIVEQFQKSNKSITILVGVPKEKYFEGFQKLFFKFGIFKSGCLSFFKHYQSETSDDIVKYIMKNGKTLYSGFGFTEDELISLKHTYQNIKNKRKFLVEGTNLLEQKLDLPIFICGSGPSLDEAHEVIKENQDKAIVVSCGSSLMALKKYGIKPDIHVEIERTDPVLDWLVAIEDTEYVKDILFVGMNTVFPPVMSMFKESVLFLKPNDAATDMVRVSYEHNLASVYGTNPTVVNGAAGFFNHIKSGDMYLFGCDFGYKDPDKHHSTQTGYFDQFEGVATEFPKGPKRKGNFGGVVYTDHTFDAARVSCEYTIRNHIGEDEKKKVFNCSDGAAIVGTEPLRASDIKLESAINKSSVIEYIVNSSSNEALTADIWQSEYKDRLAKILDLIDNVLIKEEFLNAEFEANQVIDIFDTVHQKMMELDYTKDIVAIRLLNGSITYIETTIVGYVYLIGNNQYCKKFIKESLQIMFNYYKELRDLIVLGAKEMEGE